MPTKHPKILVTMTEDQRMDLKAEAADRNVSMSDLVRRCLIELDMIRDDPLPHGGLRQIWTCDDDTAQITSTPAGYHVDLTIDDWHREHHDFATLEEAQSFLRSRRFSPA